MENDEMKKQVPYLSDTDLVDISNQIKGKNLPDHCVNHAIQHLIKTGSHIQPAITFHDYVSGYMMYRDHGAKAFGQ